MGYFPNDELLATPRICLKSSMKKAIRHGTSALLSAQTAPTFRTLQREVPILSYPMVSNGYSTCHFWPMSLAIIFAPTPRATYTTDMAFRPKRKEQPFDNFYPLYIASRAHISLVNLGWAHFESKVRAPLLWSIIASVSFYFATQVCIHFVMHTHNYTTTRVIQRKISLFNKAYFFPPETDFKHVP